MTSTGVAAWQFALILRVPYPIVVFSSITSKNDAF